MPEQKEQTVHDRVVQAILGDAKLAAEMIGLKEALMAAKQSEDAVRKDVASAEAKALLKPQYEAAVAKAQAVYDKAIAQARVPLDAATAKYNAAALVAQGLLDKAKNEGAAEYEAKMSAQTKARELALAEAAATVHRAQREVTSLATTIDQYRANMKNQLGINMAALTV